MAPRIGTRVELNSGDQIVCKVLAKLRHQNNRSKNVKNSKIGDQSDEMTDLQGIGAEVAFCRLFNIFPDLSIHTRSTQEDTGDAVLPTGETVDVKATHYPTGRLLAVPWKLPKVDLFSLMVGKFPIYTFKGFMRSSELIKPVRLGDLGHGNTYIATQDELKELDKVRVTESDRLFSDEAISNLTK